MKLVIGLTAFTIQACNTNQNCNDRVIRNIHYEKEILVNDRQSPYQLAIDYNTNTLFFSYYNSNRSEVFSSAYVNLETKENGTIPGINKGFANTVDNQNHIAYLGGIDGIYKFDYNTKTARHLKTGQIEHSIWHMFFKDNVYYTTYPNEQVYMLKDGNSELVPELADTRALLIAVNNDLDFYFVNSTGLFKLKKGNEQAMLLGDYNANAMTSDINGNLYFSTPYGIYFINEDDTILKIASIPDVYGIAIENDGNIIYASDNAIVRLKPTQ